jgi:hypothetical protein
MLLKLIELAEEMYATSQKKTLESIDGGLIARFLMEEYAIRLGNLTEEIGHTLHLQLDAIKDRDAHIKALEHELSQ